MYKGAGEAIVFLQLQQCYEDFVFKPFPLPFAWQPGPAHWQELCSPSHYHLYVPKMQSLSCELALPVLGNCV